MLALTQVSRGLNCRVKPGNGDSRKCQWERLWRLRQQKGRRLAGPLVTL